MDFKNQYPEYADVQDLIHRARLERSVAIAHFIAASIAAVIDGARRLVDIVSHGHAAEADRRTVEVDPFLRRSIAPHR
jgi:hypothetical protein